MLIEMLYDHLLRLFKDKQANQIIVKHSIDEVIIETEVILNNKVIEEPFIVEACDTLNYFSPDFFTNCIYLNQSFKYYNDFIDLNRDKLDIFPEYKKSKFMGFYNKENKFVFFDNLYDFYYKMLFDSLEKKVLATYRLNYKLYYKYKEDFLKWVDFCKLNQETFVLELNDDLMTELESTFFWGYAIGYDKLECTYNCTLEFPHIEQPFVYEKSINFNKVKNSTIYINMLFLKILNNEIILKDFDFIRSSHSVIKGFPFTFYETGVKRISFVINEENSILAEM